MDLRPYQVAAVDAVREAWRAHRRVLLVAPTGSGKTAMGASLVAGPTLWVAHRRELVAQARDALARIGVHAGAVVAGVAPDSEAPVQVGTVQTLLARDARPPADLLVLDECHHYAAADWSALAEAYPHARCLGATATPERSDGRGLADLFDHLIVAAQYGDLIRDGHILPCRVFQSPELLDSSHLALDPVAAYQAHGEGGLALLFAGSVKLAEDFAARFRAAGIAAEALDGDTPVDARSDMLARFAGGALRVLCNVFVLTEGVDLPPARIAILARGSSHVSPYLQMVGRVLRPSPGKPDAILLDLTGASHLHGLPTEDRHYVLAPDEGIRRTSKPALTVCQQCGVTHYSAQRACPGCGFARPVVERRPTIYSLALREVFAGAETPRDAKASEWERLRSLCRARGWGLDWGVREYGKLFPGERPALTSDDKRALLHALRRRAAERGFKPGWAAHRYRAATGVWPRGVG